MAVPEEKVLNVEKFRKQIKHFDNPNVGESGNAIRLALRQCEAADMSFIDALQKTFGGKNGELTAARERISKLEDEAETLAQKVLEFQDANNELQNEIDRLIAERPDDDADFEAEPQPSPRAEDWRTLLRRLTSISWTMVNSLTATLGAITGVALFIRSWPAVGLQMAFFLVWAVAVLRIEGWRILVAKMGIWFAGWAVVVALMTDVFVLSKSMLLILPWFWWWPLVPLDGAVFYFAELFVLAGAVWINLSGFSSMLVNGVSAVLTKGKSVWVMLSTKSAKAN